jgi:Zn-finger nucleic acid-binding protein
MKCINCQGEINSGMVHAIKNNTCPFCGRVIMSQDKMNQMMALSDYLKVLQFTDNPALDEQIREKVVNAVVSKFSISSDVITTQTPVVRTQASGTPAQAAPQPKENVSPTVYQQAADDMYRTSDNSQQVEVEERELSQEERAFLKANNVDPSEVNTGEAVKHPPIDTGQTAGNPVNKAERLKGVYKDFQAKKANYVPKPIARSQ